MELPAKPLHLLERDEWIAYLEDVCRELSAAYIELSQVRIQYMWNYGQAYRASQSAHVSGRIQEAEIAAAAIKEDELELLGKIDSLITIRDFLQSIQLEVQRVLVRPG